MVVHARIKQIEVDYHFILECVIAGDADLRNTNANLQIIDIFTKALGINELWQFTTSLGLSITD